MGLFSRQQKPGGLIAYFGLWDWWMETFSEADRKLLAQEFRDAPTLGGRLKDLDSDDMRGFQTSQRASQLIAEIAVLADKSAPQLVPTLLAKAEEAATGSEGALDLHFALSQAIQLWYKRRETVEGAFDQAVGACQRQIAIAPRAAVQLKRENIWPVSHRGYQQLAIIREKQGDLAEAIRLSREAQQGGWLDSKRDWSARIAKLEKRLAKTV